METAIVAVILTGLLLVSIRSRPDWVTTTLGVTFAFAVAVSFIMPFEVRFPVLAVLDAIVVAVMAAVWTARVDMRAYCIGFIGLGKLVARLAYASDPYISHWGFAATMNCAFAMQVVIAGGLVDAVGIRLDDLLRRYFPRRHKLLRNVAER